MEEVTLIHLNLSILSYNVILFLKGAQKCIFEIIFFLKKDSGFCPLCILVFMSWVCGKNTYMW